MNNLETLEFIFQFALGASSVASWIWAIVTFLGILFVVGSLWGRAWNREWRLTSHGGLFTAVLIMALLSSFAVLNLRTVIRMETWFQEQRADLAKSVADSSRLKRTVLVETWTRLNATQAQTDLVPPDQSGDQVRLNTPEDAALLASVAAEEARAALRLKPPFLFGAPLETKSPTDIAAETADIVKITATGFPRTVSSENEWTTTAATLQVNYALDTTQSLLNPRLGDLKTASIWLIIITLLLLIGLISQRSLSDIQINPKA
jgi:hypothetical protein